MGVVLRQAWSKRQWTVLMGYLTTSTNVRRYQTHHRQHFCCDGVLCPSLCIVPHLQNRLCSVQSCFCYGRLIKTTNRYKRV